MKAIIKRPEYLPNNIEKLREFLLIGKEKLKAHEAKLRAIENINLAKNAKQAALIDAQDIATVLLWAEAKLGELLAGIPSKYDFGSRGRTKTLPPGITKKQSHFAQKIASHPNIIEQVIQEAIDKEEIPRRTDVLNKIKSVHFSSKSSEWTTPEIIINKTVQLLGEIDLDPCSNPDFPNIPAKNHFTKKEDGLIQDWIGKVYMNPPYGGEIKKWIYHLAEQFEKGNVLEAIALVPSRTDTEWFRRLKKYLRCFIWGRLRFGEQKNSAPFPSMVVYLGKSKGGFVQIFSDIGDIYAAYEST